jgi:hypothetical protein
MNGYEKTEPEIEITPEMINAGCAEMASFDRRYEADEDIVARIYRAMVTVVASHIRTLVVDGGRPVDVVALEGLDLTDDGTILAVDVEAKPTFFWFWRKK